MRLLLTNYMETTQPGGINRIVREISTELARRGHDVTVLQANPAHLPAQGMCDGVRILRVGSRVAPYLYHLHPAMWRYLRAHFTVLNPDLVHVHGYATLLPWEILRFMQARATCPVAYSPHYDIYSHDTLGGRHLWSAFNKTLGIQSFKRAQRVICASRFESTNVQRDFAVPASRITVIPHGITRVDVGRPPDTDPDCICLLYFGWLLELKGVQYILRALHVLRHTLGKRAMLTVVGDGPYKGALQKLAQELSVAPWVSWYSFLPEGALYATIRAADTALLLSRSENYGITVAEALGLGVPCIIAKTTALTEFLDEPGCFGIAYPPDPQDLARLIVHLKETRPPVGPLSSRIQTWDKVADQYEALYEALVHERSGA
ncbi:MAG: glycosyltransferase family 4 protein [Halobacteriota archaeon]